MKTQGNRRLLLVATCFLVAAVGAQGSFIVNGSFENGTFVGDINKTDSLASGSTAITGWTTTTTNGTNTPPAFTAWIQNGNPWNIPASDGQFFLDLTGYADFSNYGGVTQSFATTPGTSYLVTFDLGYGGNSGAFGGPVQVRATAAAFSQTFTSGSGTPSPAVWNHESFTFTATGATTQLTLVGVSTAGGDYIGLDNVDVELANGAVPEPNTIPILIGSIGLIGWMARRRRGSSKPASF